MTRRRRRRKASRPLRTWTTRGQSPEGASNRNQMKRNFKLAKIYAHRGYHDKPAVPENSMAAFRRAVEHGLASEIDVHLIADGTLVVFHDDDLERETGVKGSIEAYDLTNLRKLRLEGTDEKIPTFDEVLGLYENSGLALLIELKVVKRNYKALARAVAERLDSYRGEYAVQSFDPRALMEYRRLRPDVIRGQLSKNFVKSTEGLPLYQVVLLTNLMLNRLTKPDFINYQFADRDNRVLRRLVDKKGYPEVTWTIRSAQDLKKAVADGCVPIFEKIDPKDLKPVMQK